MRKNENESNDLLFEEKKEKAYTHVNRM